MGKVLKQQRDFVEAEQSEISDGMQSLDSVDEEIKQMEQALDRPPTETDPSAEVVAAFSPPQSNALNPPDQQVFFIDSDDFLAQQAAFRHGEDSARFPDDTVLW